MEEQIKKIPKNKNESAFLTIKIGNNFLGTIEDFRTEFIKDFYNSLKYKHECYSYSENEHCFLCKEKKEVYGFTVPYAFYTFNNPGFIAGGHFDQKEAYKNLPICLECVFALEAGKKVVEEEITPINKVHFDLPGLKYLIIPKLIDNSFETIDEIVNIFSIFKSNDFINSPQNQIDNEIDIIDILKEANNYANFNFMIFIDPNAEYKIKLFLEDITPTRLKKLAKVKQELDKYEFFQNYYLGKDKKTKEDIYKDLKMNFNLIYNLLNVKEENKVHKEKERYYFEIINSIFTGKKISYEHLLKEIMDKICISFKNKRAYNKTVLEAFLFLNYLKKLNLFIDFNEDNKMETQILQNEQKSELRKKIGILFDDFSDFYSCDARKVAFLTGVLVKKLLNNQYQMNRTQPFRKELNRFKLDEKLLKSIFNKAIEKLESYKRNYYKELEEIIIEYYEKAGNNWDLSNEDISFFFVAGLTKANYVLPKQEGFEEEPEEDKENDK